MLNAVYTYAMGHKDLYPGVSNPGAQATKEAIEGATGLKINYWALVDLKGFEALVNAVGGITLDVNRDIPIGGGHAKMYGYVEEGQGPTPGRVRGAVVRPLPLRLLRLRPDGPTEVRDERDAAAAGSGHRADEVQPDRHRQQGDRRHRHPHQPGRHDARSGAEGQDQAGRRPSASCRRRSIPATRTSTRSTRWWRRRSTSAEAADNPAPAASAPASAPSASAAAPSGGDERLGEAERRRGQEEEGDASNAEDVGAVCAASGQ